MQELLNRSSEYVEELENDLRQSRQEKENLESVS